MLTIIIGILIVGGLGACVNSALYASRINKQHPASGTLVEVNGAETFRGAVERELATLLLTSAHPDPELQFAARVPAFATGN